jgi:hypothetical protein
VKSSDTGVISAASREIAEVIPEGWMHVTITRGFPSRKEQAAELHVFAFHVGKCFPPQNQGESALGSWAGRLAASPSDVDIRIAHFLLRAASN